MIDEMDELCACGHARHWHDKVDNDVVYGWCGECLHARCDCEGFRDSDLDDLPANVRHSG